MIEVGDDKTGTIVGFLDIDPNTNSVRLEKHDFKVRKMDITVRVTPGKFAVFTVKAVLIPVHILSKVVVSTIFKPRGTVQYIENTDDPFLEHGGKLNG